MQKKRSNYGNISYDLKSKLYEKEITVSIGLE